MAKLRGWTKEQVEDVVRDMDHPYELLSKEEMAAMMVSPTELNADTSVHADIGGML